jgi:hypothetical protein
MLRTNLTISAMLLAGLASAQTQSGTAATPSDPSAPALVSSVAPQNNDSPLVQAAKRAVAARQRVTVKIDNESVRKATKLLTTTDNARTIPTFPPLPPPQQQRPAATSVAAQQKAEKPKPEIRRPMDEAEALYETGEEVPEPAPTQQKDARPQARKPKP